MSMDESLFSNISVFNSAEYVSLPSFYDLLIIDDYGAERNSQFALQNVFDVINRRWESVKQKMTTLKDVFSKGGNENE